MGQHAALRRYVEAPDDVVQHGQQVEDRRRVVARRVDADDGIAAAEHQSVDDGGGDAALVIGRVIGLQADGHAPLEADRVAKPRHHLDLARGEDEVLVAHDLGCGGGHFRRDAGGEPGQHLGRRCIGQQPIAEVANRHVRDGRECRRIVTVDDEARDVVDVVGDEQLFEEPFQRHVGERHLGGDVLLGARCGNARQDVAGAQRRRLGEQLLEIGEPVCRLPPSRLIHGPLRRSSQQIIARRRGCKLLLTNCVGARSAEQISRMHVRAVVSGVAARAPAATRFQTGQSASTTARATLVVFCARRRRHGRALRIFCSSRRQVQRSLAACRSAWMRSAEANGSRMRSTANLSRRSTRPFNVGAFGSI